MTLEIVQITWVGAGGYQFVCAQSAPHSSANPRFVAWGRSQGFDESSFSTRHSDTHQSEVKFINQDSRIFLGHTSISFK